MKIKKFLISALAVMTVGVGAMGLTACDFGGSGLFEPMQSASENYAENDWSLQAVYARAQDMGYKGSLEDFLETVKGKDGEDGADGVGIQDICLEEGELIVYLTNGDIRHLGIVRGENGIDGVGIVAAEIDGEGCLIITLSNGDMYNCGMVKGENGLDGEKGEDGKDGQDGADGADGKDGQDGADGADGKDGVGVQNVSINEDGELVIVLTDGNIHILDKVIGEDGADGADGTDGKDGKDGADGKDGVGIESISISENGEMTVVLTNNTVLNLGNVKGADGKDGVDGTDGKDGTDGVGIQSVYFNESGELIVVQTDSTEINCGRMPTCIHSYGEWTTGKEATCQNMGYETRACEICSVVEYNFLDKTEHAFGDWQTMLAACTGKYDMRTCSVCAHTEVTASAYPAKHLYFEGNCEHCGYEQTQGLEYALSYDGTYYSVTGIGTCTDTDIIIPAIHNSKPVKKIASNAFDDENITSVTMFDSVMSIGDWAFRNCDRLTSVTIPDSVTSIGYQAFRNCDRLTSVTIPDSVTIIGGWAFDDCDSLTSVTFGENSQLTSIGYDAFSSCDSLTSIEIPDSVTSIGSHAFSWCYSLTSVTIGNGVGIPNLHPLKNNGVF